MNTPDACYSKITIVNAEYPCSQSYIMEGGVGTDNWSNWMPTNTAATIGLLPKNREKYPAFIFFSAPRVPYKQRFSENFRWSGSFPGWYSRPWINWKKESIFDDKRRLRSRNVHRGYGAWYFYWSKTEKFCCGHTYMRRRRNPSLAAMDDPYSLIWAFPW